MGTHRASTIFRVSVRETGRNYVLIGLLIALPIAFITIAFAVTQDAQLPIELPIDGEYQIVMRGLPEVHGVAMTPLTSTILAGIVGLLLMQDAKIVDGRLVLAGYRGREVVLARFGTLGILVLLVTAVSVGVLAYDVMPEQPMLFILAMFAVTLIYGLVGMLLGIVSDRMAGLWTILILSMLDVGIFQSPLFPMGDNSWWVKLLPGHHPMEVIHDAGLTDQPDTLSHLGFSFLYLVIIGAIAIGVFYLITNQQRSPLPDGIQ